MLELLLAITLSIFVHISTMALFGYLYGIKINEISFGVGLRLIRFKQVCIKLLPLGGYVRFADSRSPDAKGIDTRQLFNFRPAYMRAAIAISGCLFMLLISAVLAGSQAFDALVSTYVQFFSGALSPLNTGKAYIHEIAAFIDSQGFVSIYAITQVKIAALNLLPLPMLNGGQAILVFFDKAEQPPGKLMNGLMQASMFVYMGLIVSWLAALFVTYV